MLDGFTAENLHAPGAGNLLAVTRVSDGKRWVFRVRGAGKVWRLARIEDGPARIEIDMDGRAHDLFIGNLQVARICYNPSGDRLGGIEVVAPGGTCTGNNTVEFGYDDHRVLNEVNVGGVLSTRYTYDNVPMTSETDERRAPALSM